MKALSDKVRVNVGLAVADGDEMVYLHAVRRHDTGSARYRTSGYRVPIETTALGRAYLAACKPEDRERLLLLLCSRHRRNWTKISREIHRAVEQVQNFGYCSAE
ncbi:MAG TPA: IclR family transcriptional regulator, partial [Burkholderiales bacterium]|nr:IclR family transcriptional regulator [Burkholderiales bacterium]